MFYVLYDQASSRPLIYLEAVNFPIIYKGLILCSIMNINLFILLRCMVLFALSMFALSNLC